MCSRFRRESRMEGIFRSAIGLYMVAFALALVSCAREKRELRTPPQHRAIIETGRQSELQPGGPLLTTDVANPYEGNAQAISEGKRLFDWYNCSGCHGHGGGGMGPPLMDHTWIYGGEPANIFESILKGRPNGMPAWGRIPAHQIWQLVAYVRSLSGKQPESATPVRGDEMQKTSEVPQTTAEPK